MMLTAGMLVPGCGLPPASLERVGELGVPPPPLAAQSLAASLGATPATPAAAAGKKRPREEEEQQLLHLVLQKQPIQLLRAVYISNIFFVQIFELFQDRNC